MTNCKSSSRLKYAVPGQKKKVAVFTLLQNNRTMTYVSQFWQFISQGVMFHALSHSSISITAPLLQEWGRHRPGVTETMCAVGQQHPLFLSLNLGSSSYHRCLSIRLLITLSCHYLFSGFPTRLQVSPRSQTVSHLLLYPNTQHVLHLAHYIVGAQEIFVE